MEGYLTEQNMRVDRHLCASIRSSQNRIRDNDITKNLIAFLTLNTDYVPATALSSLSLAASSISVTFEDHLS
jgi:hypothetical protein